MQVQAVPQAALLGKAGEGFQSQTSTVGIYQDGIGQIGEMGKYACLPFSIYGFC